jgi:membrane associated rhomboid family serine protease
VIAIVPYQVDVGMSRWPFSNFALIAAIVVAQFYAVAALLDDPDAIEPFILQGWSASQLFGHMFVHGGVLHLLGNVIFLWTFGNAVCAKIGNLVYIPLFLALGIAAASAHNLIAHIPAIGASGAINGIVGMYLVYYPLNNVTCGYWLLFRVGTFYLSSMWIILLFFAFDLWGATRGGGGVAYWAHLGGFLTGAAVASLSLLSGFVEMTDTERSLLEVLGLTD